MDAYLHTSLIGGTDGELFNDVLKTTNGDGKSPDVDSDIVFLTPTIGELILDVNHPIAQITVSHGWIVSTPVSVAEIRLMVLSG